MWREVSFVRGRQGRSGSTRLRVLMRGRNLCASSSIGLWMRGSLYLRAVRQLEGRGRRIPTTPSKWLTHLNVLSTHGEGKSGRSLAEAGFRVGKVPPTLAT